MSTILDIQPTHSAQVVPDDPPKAADGEEKVESGAVKNAKRRKMDKKRAKREEQRRAADEVVDAVGEFCLYNPLLSSPLHLNVLPFHLDQLPCSLFG